MSTPSLGTAHWKRCSILASMRCSILAARGKQILLLAPNGMSSKLFPKNQTSSSLPTNLDLRPMGTIGCSRRVSFLHDGLEVLEEPADVGFGRRRVGLRPGLASEPPCANGIQAAVLAFIHDVVPPALVVSRHPSASATC